MKINLKNLFRWTYLIGLFLILLLPILAFPPYFSPPDWAKAITFRIIFSILIFFFIVQILYQKEFKKYLVEKIKFIPLLFSIPLLIFALLIILSTIFSLEPFFSFWGSPARGDGSFNLLLYILLTFFSYLVVEKEDWKKVWTAAVIGGLLVSTIGIIQQFGATNGVLISYSQRPPSTMGNTNMLAAYLIILSFISLFLGAIEKKRYKKIFYLLSPAIFLFVIFLTLSRAAFLGLLAGFFCFLFFYSPKAISFKWARQLVLLKILALIFLALTVYGIYYANYGNTNSKFFTYLNNSKIAQGIINRLSIKSVLTDPRFSAWQVGLRSIEERPLLGYGPENFSIAFDKHYNLLSTVESTNWWDRAHNFLLEIGVTLGIPALIAYLLFWIAILYILQKFKHNKEGKDYFVPHTIQVMIITLMVNNLFSFDCVPTYLLSYLVLGYCLSLTTEIKIANTTYNIAKNSFLKSAIIFVIFVGLIIFIWQYNILPMRVNAAINWKNFYQEKGECKKSINAIKPALSWHAFTDGYVRFEYMDAIQSCLNGKITEEMVQMTKDAIAAGLEATKIDPYYTRAWIYLGHFENTLMESTNDFSLTAKADYYFKTAENLSPNRYETQIEWAKTSIITEDYQKAMEKIDKCIKINPNYSTCYLYKSLINIYLKNFTESEKYRNIAVEKGFYDEKITTLEYLLKVYVKLTNKDPHNLEYYKQLALIYNELLWRKPHDFQNHASLAFVYAKLGQLDDAATQALWVFYYSPESKANVDSFFKQINYTFNQPNNADYHFSLAEDWFQKAKTNDARREALIALYISGGSRDDIKEFLSSL